MSASHIGEALAKLRDSISFENAGTSREERIAIVEAAATAMAQSEAARGDSDSLIRLFPSGVRFEMNVERGRVELRVPSKHAWKGDADTFADATAQVITLMLGTALGSESTAVADRCLGCDRSVTAFANAVGLKRGEIICVDCIRDAMAILTERGENFSDETKAATIRRCLTHETLGVLTDEELAVIANTSATYVCEIRDKQRAKGLAR